jgi:hypothetical protein
MKYSDGSEANYPCAGERVSESQLGSGEPPTTVKGEYLISCWASEDCLPKDTKVTLVDGTEKIVQDVKVGDKLQSQTGTNTVLEIQMSKTDKREFYRVNEGKFIVTEGHPFLTQRGWASAGLGAVLHNKGEVNWANRELKVGDMLIGRDNVIKVTSIEKTVIPDAETYNLKLDGDNSFLANGVVVQGYGSISIQYTSPKK